MRQAEKFNRPIVCLVDTQGAFCGMEAEERGQGNAIAENLELMAGLRVPIVSVLLGEGGSGGALALALANRVAMQQHAVYSVLSPEGFASILWKDGSRASEAAEIMGCLLYTSKDSDTIVTGRGTGHPVRGLKNKFARACRKREMEASSPDDLEGMYAGSLKRAVEGDMENGSILAGQVAALVKKRGTAKELIAELMAEAEAVSYTHLDVYKRQELCDELGASYRIRPRV